MSDSGKVIRFRDFQWEGVPVREYKQNGEHFRHVTRQVLLGEGSAEQDLSFITRYFEIAAGGYSTLERHQHPHVVIVLRGRGTVQLGHETFAIEAHDAVYVAPGAPHQFRADRGETLGFVCIVDRMRDRPQAL